MDGTFANQNITADMARNLVKNAKVMDNNNELKVIVEQIIDRASNGYTSIAVEMMSVVTREFLKSRGFAVTYDILSIKIIVSW